MTTLNSHNRRFIKITTLNGTTRLNMDYDLSTLFHPDAAHSDTVQADVDLNTAGFSTHDPLPADVETLQAVRMPIRECKSNPALGRGPDQSSPASDSLNVHAYAASLPNLATLSIAADSTVLPCVRSSTPELTGIPLELRHMIYANLVVEKRMPILRQDSPVTYTAFYMPMAYSTLSRYLHREIEDYMLLHLHSHNRVTIYVADSIDLYDGHAESVQDLLRMAADYRRRSITEESLKTREMYQRWSVEMPMRYVQRWESYKAVGYLRPREAVSEAHLRGFLREVLGRFKSPSAMDVAIVLSLERARRMPFMMRDVRQTAVLGHCAGPLRVRYEFVDHV